MKVVFIIYLLNLIFSYIVNYYRENTVKVSVPRFLQRYIGIVKKVDRYSITAIVMRICEDIHIIFIIMFFFIIKRKQINFDSGTWINACIFAWTSIIALSLSINCFLQGKNQDKGKISNYITGIICIFGFIAFSVLFFIMIAGTII